MAACHVPQVGAVASRVTARLGVMHPKPGTEQYANLETNFVFLRNPDPSRSAVGRVKPPVSVPGTSFTATDDLWK